MGISLIYGELELVSMFLAPGISFSIMFFTVWRFLPTEIRATDGFIVVVLSWLGIAFVSSIPFYFSGLAGSYIDAWLESVSAITTTGIEFIGDIEKWPSGLLWYRQQLEWFGGAGIIVMMIALMTLSEGSLLSMYYGEFGKDVRDVRVTPRLTSTAQYVFFVYSLLCLSCALGYIMSGVPVFYAFLEAMATVSTGGFTIQSIYPIYTSKVQLIISISFMILGAVGFHIHYLFYKQRSIKAYLRNTEVRLMVAFIIVGTLVGLFITRSSGMLEVLYTVVAFLTTTGFEAKISSISPIIMMTLTLFGLMGACAGSTGGGVKLIRVSIVWQEARLFLLRLMYPSAVQYMSLDGKVLPEHYLKNVRGYVALFMLTFILGVVILVASGLMLTDAFFLLCATLTNVGASVHTLPMGILTDTQKVILSIIMLLGRVEIAAFMLVCMPRYWRS